MVLLLSSCASKQEVKPDVIDVLPPVEELKLPDIGPKPDVSAEKKAPVSEEEKKADEQFVMLNFENADLETVVNTMSEMLKINYIVATGVTGKITIQSHNKIPKSELFTTFQTILEVNGFTAIKDGSFYRIVPIDTAKQQPIPIESGNVYAPPKDSSFVTQEIPLQYIKANDFANIARNLMPRGTDIIVYDPSNMLLVTALPTGIVKLTKLIEIIDVPATERDSIKTFVYNVENGEAKSLAGILKSIYVSKKDAATASPVRNLAPTPAPPTPTPTRPSRTPVRPRAAVPATTVQEGLAGEIEGDIIIEAYDDINALIIKTTPRGYMTLLETIKKLDVQAKQVLIEVLIAEISLDDTTKLGIEWLLKTSIHAENRDYQTVGGFTSSEDNTTANALLDSINTLAPITSGKAFVNIIDPGRFNVIINAAADKDKINVLASPHILALDNKEAKIEIADEIPTSTSITTGTSDINTSTSQVQFKSVGTILTVTPHINEKKQVTLKISQEVSELGKKTVLGNSGEFQGFTTRKANTTAIVQDGHTLVIGGMINERSQKTRTGIPFLSDLPLIGYLFGSTTDTMVRKELIVMVTPHVIANHEEADELTAEFQNRVKDLKMKILEKRKRAEEKAKGN